MDVIKNLYHMLLMRNKQNEAVSVCGNKTVNMLAHIFCTGLWPLHETRRRHVLNVFCPYNIRDVQRSEILPNLHVILAWKLSFFRIFFWLCFAPRTKHHATYMGQILIFEIKKYPEFDLN